MSKITSSPYFVGGLAIAVIIALIFGLAGVVGTFTGPSDKDVARAAANAAAPKADASTVSALDTRLTGLETQIAGLPTSADVTALSGEIAALRDALANTPTPDYGADLADLSARIAALERRIATLETAAAATETPAAQPAGETRLELDSCPGYDSLHYNGAVDPQNLTDTKTLDNAWVTQCFVIKPQTVMSVADVTAWYESITSIEFTTVGGMPRSAWLGNGDGYVSWIMTNWDLVNAGTGTGPSVATVSVTVPDAAAAYVTLGELMIGYHPAGPGHEGLFVYLSYVVDDSEQVLNADLARAYAIIP